MTDALEIFILAGQGRVEFTNIFGIDVPRSRALLNLDDQLGMQGEHPVELVDGCRAEHPHDRWVGHPSVPGPWEPRWRFRIRKYIEDMRVCDENVVAALGIELHFMR